MKVWRVVLAVLALLSVASAQVGISGGAGLSGGAGIRVQAAAPAFGISAVLDNFGSYSDWQALSVSGNWLCASTWLPGWADSNMAGVSGEARPSGGESACYWSAASFGPDSEVFVKIVTVPTNGGATLCARYNTSSNTGYCLDISYGSPVSPQWSIRKDSPAGTSLAGPTTQTISAGDSIGLEVIGTAVKAYYKSGSGAWTEVLSATDSSYSSAGRLVFGANSGDAGVQFDNFAGGSR